MIPPVFNDVIVITVVMAKPEDWPQEYRKTFVGGDFAVVLKYTQEWLNNYWLNEWELTERGEFMHKDYRHGPKRLAFVEVQVEG